MQRIGVFVCHCGTNIAATVDIARVVEAAAKEPGVVHAEDYQYMCSEAGQLKIREAIKEKNLKASLEPSLPLPNPPIPLPFLAFQQQASCKSWQLPCREEGDHGSNGA